MSFWKKLFGAKESEKTGGSHKNPTQPRAASHQPPASVPPTPATRPERELAPGRAAIASDRTTLERPLPSLEKSMVDLLGRNLLGQEKYDRLRKGTGAFPVKAEEVSSLGREILLFATPAERTYMSSRKAADVLLARIGLDRMTEFLFEGAFKPTIEQQFAEELKYAGLPGDVFSRNEILQLVKGLEWFLENSSRLPFKMGMSGTPILASYSGELITAGDGIRARTRMFLAALEAGGKPITLEDYVGYLADVWYGVPYQPSPLSYPGTPSNPATPPTQPQQIAPPKRSVTARTQAAPFYDAIIQGDLEKAKQLLQGDPDLVFSQDKIGRTLLHHVKRKDAAELLLANKVDVNARDDDGRTPLLSAAVAGYREVVEVLLANHAEIDAKDKKGRSALQVAAYWGQQDVAKLLLGSKAEFGIHDVAACGEIGKVNALLAENPGLASKVDSDGNTPLHGAARNDHKDVVKVLLAHGAEVNAKDNEGATPLHLAAGRGNKDVAELLLANKAEVNAKRRGDATPLHNAASGGHKDVMRLLLAHEADVNATTWGGDTPLHYAALGSGVHIWGRGDSKAVVELLLATKADVNATNTDGKTPMGRATEKEIKELLRRRGGHE